MEVQELNLRGLSSSESSSERVRKA